ncbi:MAG: PilZ domain-containing protein [Bdellovibrio sp.]|nr:PilZ domain-containing protein [Bdellovibrio sp.]
METMNSPAPRTPLNLDVSFRRNYARQDTTGILKNISLSGAFLEISNHDLRVDEKVNLTFIVGSRERKISAQIIWKNSYGAGIKFLPLNNRDVQIVDDLIYFVESKRIGHRGILDGILKKVA